VRKIYDETSMLVKAPKRGIIRACGVTSGLNEKNKNIR